MTDITKNTQELVLKKISDLYRIGLVCYLIPTFFVALIILDSFTIRATEIISFILLLCIMFPLALIGLSSTLTGIALSSKIHDQAKKKQGYYKLVLGIAVFLGQIFGFVFVYLKIH